MSHSRKVGLSNGVDESLLQEFEGILADFWENHDLIQEIDDNVFELISRLERLKSVMTGEDPHDYGGGLETFVVPTENEMCSFSKDSAEP